MTTCRTNRCLALEGQWGSCRAERERVREPSDASRTWFDRCLVWIPAAALLAATSGLAFAQSTVRVSLSPAGTQGNYHSFWGAPSADGRFVAYQSLASNLVIGDLNGHLPDIFRKDLVTGDNVLVSLDSAGGTANSGSVAPSISADGLLVAFESFASNLAAGDTNGVYDIFVHDMVTGATTRVSVGSAGTQADAQSGLARISGDGRHVTFESDATNLVAGDTNGVTDVFVHDRQTGITMRVSTDSSAGAGNAASTWPAISADGRFVAFQSEATNLVAGDTNGLMDVFVKDLVTGTTRRISVDSAGAEGTAASSHPSLSGDGRIAAFESEAPNLVAGDTNGAADVFVHDLANGSTLRVSVSSIGAQSDGQSLMQGAYQVSADGRFVAFDSTASNLVAGDTNMASDCFVHDRLAGVTERVDVSTAGMQANSSARAPAITGDGRHVVFESSATNLAGGDNNLSWDVFRRDRGGSDATRFCFGDGAGTPCPCGNDGPAGAQAGCVNSFGHGGELAVSGVASVSADSLVLHGTQMPDSSALYFQGTTALNGGAGVTFGDGLRCAGGAIMRLGTKFNAQGASQYPAAGDPPISVRGADAAGSVRTYQCWYRNPAGPCGSAFNLTNGVRLVWSP